MMQMPEINECDVSECAYNTDNMCHALAVTIGDSGNPECDTFCRSSNKGGDMEARGHVGACKTSSCRFNERLECQAPGIRVGHAQDEVDCLTFQHM